MPIKRVQFPDGSIHRVEVPEGATNEQILAFVQSQQSPKADFGNVQSKASTVATPRPEQSPSIGQRIGREIGLGARASLQGIGGTLGIITDPLARGADWVANKVAPPAPSMSDLITGNAPRPRRIFGTAREGFDALADTLNLPEPETASERIGGGITEALSGGGGLIGLGRSLATRAPGLGQAAGEFLSSQPVTQLVSMIGGSGAAGVTRESGGGPGAQALAALAGGLGAPGLKTVGAMGVRGLVRGARSELPSAENGFKGVGMGRGISDFSSVGASPSVGQATGNRRTQGLESLLAGSPTASGRMAAFAERQGEDIGAGLRERADQFFPNASAERAGRAIERGADTFAGNVKATRSALYWQADKLIPPNTALPLTRTWQTLDSLVSPVPGATATTGALVNPKIAEMARNVANDLATNGGAMPYEAVRALRTRIGEELTDFSLSADRPTAQYKRLYAALSQDLEEAARKQGPAAEQAYKRANAYTRASADRLEQVQRVVDKNGGPEKVFSAVMAGTRDGGTTLRSVMQSLDKEGQKAVTAAVIKRMGMATPGQQNAAGEAFSAQTFLRNWNRVSSEAKRALFDRHGPQFSADMDKIARVAERIRTGSKVFANPSGTANRAAAIGYYGSLPAAGLAGAMGAGPLPLAGLIVTGIGANVAARALTSPRVVSWLARTTEMPASALPQQIVVLKQIAKDDPDAAELVAELERK